jgi:hypothetical protein
MAVAFSQKLAFINILMSSLTIYKVLCICMYIIYDTYELIIFFYYLGVPSYWDISSQVLIWWTSTGGRPQWQCIHVCFLLWRDSTYSTAGIWRHY